MTAWSWFGLFADGPGKKTQAVSLLDPGGSGNTVYLQVGVIGDPNTAGQIMAVNASGQATVADANSAAFVGVVAMTVGTTYTAQRSVGVLAESTAWGATPSTIRCNWCGRRMHRTMLIAWHCLASPISSE